MRFKSTIMPVLMAFWLLFISIGGIASADAWTNGDSDTVAAQGNDTADGESGLLVDACIRSRSCRVFASSLSVSFAQLPSTRTVTSVFKPQIAKPVPSCNWQFIQRASAPARAPTA